MEQRAIGRLKVSVMGLGCNSFGARCDERSACAIVAAALDEGITFFDTADVYGDGRSERILRVALGAARADVVVASKFGATLDRAGRRTGAGRRAIRDAVRRSLRRLGTDYVDLYQQHFPDPLTPCEETLTALQELVTEGVVREFGCCNFSADQVRDSGSVAVSADLPPYASVQTEFNLLRRNFGAEVALACLESGSAIVAHSPLAAGLLAGRRRSDGSLAPGSRLAALPPRYRRRLFTQANLALVDQLEACAISDDSQLADIALRWLLRQPAVSALVVGASSPSHVHANVRAVRATISASEEASLQRTLAGE